MRRLGIALATSFILVGTAAAADLPAKMPTKAPIAPAVYNWTGFYAGLNAGYSWGKQDNSLVTIGGVTLFSNSDKINGFIGGGQIGYNWQINQLVLGIEADIQWSGQKGDGSFLIVPVGFFANLPASSSITYSDKLKWFGTVRGRLGWANDRWLAYLTGGWAYGQGSISGTSTGGIVAAFSGSRDYSGWTIGGGMEWAFRNNWSAKIEYLYIDFGNGPTVALTPALNIVGGKMTDNIVRLGVNYKF